MNHDSESHCTSLPPLWALSFCCCGALATALSFCCCGALAAGLASLSTFNKQNCLVSRGLSHIRPHLLTLLRWRYFRFAVHPKDPYGQRAPRSKSMPPITRTSAIPSKVIGGGRAEMNTGGESNNNTLYHPSNGQPQRSHRFKGYLNNPDKDRSRDRKSPMRCNAHRATSQCILAFNNGVARLPRPLTDRCGGANTKTAPGHSKICCKQLFN